MTPSQRHDIAHLAEKLRDGEILADEHARLEQILGSDAEARRFYLDSQLLHASLQTLLTNIVFVGGAALVTFGGSTDEVYLVLNDGTAGYDATTDGVIRIKYTGKLDEFAII